VAVKRGLSKDGLDHLDTDAYRKAKLGAIHLQPREARRRIREGAKEAASLLTRERSRFRYPAISPPYVRTARIRKQGESPPWSARDEHPSSIIALLNIPYTKVEEGTGK